MLGMTEHDGLVKLMLTNLRKNGHIFTDKLDTKLPVKNESLLDQSFKKLQHRNHQRRKYSPVEA